MPTFSLILATRGRTAELDRFFSSIETANTNDYECLVVDQNVDDRLTSILDNWRSKIPIKHLRSLPGLSRARNVGLAAATGEVLAFPDDDCRYSEGLLRGVAMFFAANPDYSLLSVGVCDDTGRASGNRWLRDRCDLATPNLFRTSVGMALFVRRNAISHSLRFDESLGVGAGTRFASGEDTDYVFRLLKAGLKGRFERGLTVYHPRHDMLSGAADAARAYGYGCGMGRVIRNHAKLPLLPAFVIFDLLRGGYSLLRGQPGPARLCAIHGRGVFSGYMAAK